MSKQPEIDKANIARLLRLGASGVGAAHNEYCISSDNCSCFQDESEMLTVADALDDGSPEEKQRREDEAIVGGVRGFPIFDSEKEAERYFAAAERLAGKDA